MIKDIQAPVSLSSSVDDLNTLNKTIFEGQKSMCDAIVNLLGKGISIKATMVDKNGPRIFAKYSKDCDQLGGRHIATFGGHRHPRRLVYLALVDGCRVEWQREARHH